jgi:hypothetical protein
MPSSRSFAAGRFRRFLPLLVAALVAVGLTLSAAAFKGRAGWFAQQREAAAKKGPVLTPSVLLTLTRRGFEPAEVTVPKGPFFLVFENRSGRDTLDLRLGRSSGERLKDVTVVREAPEWSEFLDLPPGDYTVALRDSPGQTFRLKVTPQ